MFLDAQSSAKGLSPKDMATQFMRNPPLDKNLSQGQQLKTSRNPNDAKVDLCKAFFRKMQKLDLLEEVEEMKETEPEMLARESSMII